MTAPEGYFYTAVLAQSEDYALMIKALLDLHQSAIALPTALPTPDPSASVWLDDALTLQQELNTHLWSETSPSYYNTDARDDLLIRERSYEDHATPSANGIAIANLVRLAMLSNTPDYLRRAESILQTFAPIMHDRPQTCPSLFTALYRYQHPQLIKTTADAIAQLSQGYLPLSSFIPTITLTTYQRGLICSGTQCPPPATTWQYLVQQITQPYNS